MRGYKEIVTVVPNGMTWYAIDDNGEIYVSSKEPEYNPYSGMWGVSFGHMIQVGQGPRPKDASKELYRI